jgi:hypothetical protein
MSPPLLTQHHSVPIPPQVNVRGYQKQRDGLLLLLYAILIVAAIISRRPDAVFHAQFWAEDGTIWFASVYNLGLAHALILPTNGDFQSFPRLASGVAMLFPLSRAPLVMNLLAIFVQALPPIFLLTRRFAYVGGQPVRLLMALLLLALPTSFEVHANVSNSMTFLALLAFLVLVAAPPNSKAWRVFDVAVICLSGATGAFAVFLLPIAVLLFWFRRRPWTGVLLGIEVCAATIQGITIIRTAAGSRSPAPLGATPLLFMRIVGAQLIVHPLLGLKFLSVHANIAIPVCVIAFAAALLLTAYVFRKAPLELRLLMLFGAFLLAGALRSPMVSLVHPQWPDLLLPGCGGRYWVIPVVSFFWAYVWMLGRERPAIIRAVGALAIAAALWTGAVYWRYQPFVDLNFTQYADAFQQIPAGQEFTIPINPPGWKVVLHKH